MVRLLAEKHGGIACGENYHEQLMDDSLDAREFPCLCYTRDLADWHDFVRRTPEEYEAWITGVSAECEILELRLLEDICAQGKPVFVDISGHGCVNCREMEARVWSDPRVLQRLRDDFEIVTLYVDDKTRLPEDKWVTTGDGKVLKDVGRVNSRLVLDRFGVNSQPNYFILDAEGNILAGPRGYNLDADAFVAFLDR